MQLSRGYPQQMSEAQAKQLHKIKSILYKRKYSLISLNIS
jgi:hypothetical protein